MTDSETSGRHRACIGLGSNQDAATRLPEAIERLGRLDEIEILAVSTAWESAAVGDDGPDYLNAALLLTTRLSREALRSRLRAIEGELGRDRSHVSPADSVPIDLDITWFDGEPIDPSLWNLAYRALPASELLPEMASPINGETLAFAAGKMSRSTRIQPRRDVIAAYDLRDDSNRLDPLPGNHPPMTREPPPTRSFRFYDTLMAAFVTVLICSEFISAGKVARIGGFSFGAGVVFFPLSYLFGDILTEVYGYARSRKVIWVGFGALAFATFMSWVVLTLPPDPGWTHQGAWETVFGNSWRIVSASLVAFFVGEWVNSVVLAKMKVWTNGRYLWSRTIGSTIAGEAFDSALFYPAAFLGVWSTDLVIKVMLANYAMKVGTEVVLTPLTYLVIHFLKRVENEDYYDIGTNFSPLPGQD